MKNKKGFTLVELLAVVAILAVILIIAMPKVLDSIAEAKEKMFLESVQNIYSGIKMQYKLDKNEGNTSRTTIYCSSDTDSCENTLKYNSDGSSDIRYIMIVDIKGNAKCLAASNGHYSYNSSEINSVSDIVLADIIDVSEEESIAINCEGYQVQIK